MSSTWNKVLAFVAALCLLCSGFILGVPVWAYIESSRDTRMPPEAIEFVPVDTAYLAEWQKLTDKGDLSFYFRDDRDVLMVVDNRNGYAWKTGLDLPYNDDVTDPDTPREDKMNTTFNELYNSLLTAEYYDSSENIKTVASASRNDARSTLYGVNGDASHWRLEVDFTSINLQASIHMYLSETGVRFEIKDEEITGAGQSRLAAWQIAPYLGASGGQKLYFNEETGNYDIPVRNPEQPGYIFIPDGCGALIRFSSHTANLRRYTGKVYGGDAATDIYYQSIESEAVPIKEPLMPVFGIAYGDRQAAFVGYASSGAEHMEIIVSPESNQTYYTNAYPRFTYNYRYYHVYNRQGDGYFKLSADRPHYDVVMHYTFLSGSGQGTGSSHFAADYTGMAQTYRQFLIDNGTLTVKSDAKPVSLYVDMVMSDIKKGILGNTEVVTTTAKQAAEIIEDMIQNGVTALNVSLMGAQSGGIHGGKPWALNFGQTGSSGDFKKLIASGAEVSFRQDYLNINSTQMNLTSNGTRHANGQMARRTLGVDPLLVPVSMIQFARPGKSAEWMTKQAQAAQKLGVQSITLDGITRMAVSDFGSTVMTITDTIALFNETLENLRVKQGMTVNASNPNQYLWKHTDRFLDAPMFSSAYIMETDTVPFLQMVLHGTMEIYGPHANLSFYNHSDVLRMIDYNVYPSFILTYEPSHLLATTNSSEFYSTEYSLYEATILELYDDVSRSLGAVSGKAWLSRQIPQPGVTVNTYDGGTKIYINYTEKPVSIDGVTIPAESFVVA